MGNVLIIGAGGAGSVAAKKCAMNRDVFESIHLASRTLSKCVDELARQGLPWHVRELPVHDPQESLAN